MGLLLMCPRFLARLQQGQRSLVKCRLCCKSLWELPHERCRRILFLPWLVREPGFPAEPAVRDESLSVIRSIRLQSDFCNKICQNRTRAPQQVTRRGAEMRDAPAGTPP